MTISLLSLCMYVNKKKLFNDNITIRTLSLVTSYKIEVLLQNMSSTVSAKSKLGKRLYGLFILRIKREESL